MDIQCMKRECMYACTDYDLLIMYKCVKFCEINIHSFISYNGNLYVWRDSLSIDPGPSSLIPYPLLHLMYSSTIQVIKMMFNCNHWRLCWVSWLLRSLTHFTATYTCRQPFNGKNPIPYYIVDPSAGHRSITSKSLTSTTPSCIDNS